MKQKMTSEIAELAGIFAADGSMQKNHICFWEILNQIKNFIINVCQNFF